MKARWIILGSLFLAGTAWAQSTTANQPRERAEQPEARQEFPADAGLAKKFLEHRLEEASKREEHLRSLLNRLDKGEAAADIGKEYEGAGRQAARRAGEPEHADQRRPVGEQHQNGRPRLTPEEREHALAFLRENS